MTAPTLRVACPSALKFNPKSHNPRRFGAGRGGDTLQARKHKIAYPALERWMVENRFTPRMLAQEIGKHKQTVLNWLYGFNYPKLPDVWALVKLTDIPFEELFKEK